MALDRREGDGQLLRDPVVTVALAVPILGEGMNAIKALVIGLALIAGLALGYERPRDELTSGSSRAMAFPSDL